MHTCGSIALWVSRPVARARVSKETHQKHTGAPRAGTSGCTRLPRYGMSRALFSCVPPPLLGSTCQRRACHARPHMSAVRPRHWFEAFCADAPQGGPTRIRRAVRSHRSCGWIADPRKSWATHTCCRIWRFADSRCCGVRWSRAPASSQR